MHRVPKIRSLHIFAISAEKHEVEVDLLLADKHESFLQVERITSGWVARNAQSTQNNNIFVISQGKRER